MNPNAKVRSLGIARRNVLRIGIAFDRSLMCADAVCRVIAALRAFVRCPVNLHKHPVVNVGPERPFIGLEIGPVADTGLPDTSGEAGRKIVHKGSPSRYFWAFYGHRASMPGWSPRCQRVWRAALMRVAHCPSGGAIAFQVLTL